MQKSKNEIKYYDEVESIFGKIAIYASKVGVEKIAFGEVEINPSKYTELCKEDLLEFLDKKYNKNPLNFKRYIINCSDSAKAIYTELSQVKLGETISYQALGQKCGIHQRAVARYMATNNFPLLLPCHRVIASDGKLNGYAFGIEIKRKILDWEKDIVK